MNRIKVSVIAWDVGHNPVGRAHLIAEVLSRKYAVEIVGAQFPMYGRRLWKPLQGSAIPMKIFPGSDFPEHFWRMKEISGKIDGDVIYVCKPRLPSLELGILVKLRRSRPLILDVDDHELAFFKETGPMSLTDVRLQRNDRDFLVPFGRTWTRYADSLIPAADALTVSNLELKSKYGGTVLPHVKNERTFDPALYDRDRVRHDFGFEPGDRIILFVGTPRLHKGILEIVEALETLKNPRYKLCIIGSISDRNMSLRKDRLRSPHVRLFEDQPLSNLPRNLMVGDLICLLQDSGSGIADYQMPSKFTDALSMGIPVLATGVPPMIPLAEAGLVELLEDTPLAREIDRIFSDYDVFKRNAERNRAVFVSEYSYKSVAGRLDDLIASAGDNIRDAYPEFDELIGFHREVFRKKKSCFRRLMSFGSG